MPPKTLGNRMKSLVKVKVSKDTALVAQHIVIQLVETAAQVCPEPIARAVLNTVLLVYKEVEKVQDVKDRLKGLTEKAHRFATHIQERAEGHMVLNEDNKHKANKYLEDLEKLSGTIKESMDKWRERSLLHIWTSHSSLNKALNDYEERLADVVNLYNMSNLNNTYRDLRSIKQRIKSLISKSSSLATSTTANGSATPDTTNEPATVDPASVTEQPEPYFMVRDEDGTATELFLVRRRQCDRGVRLCAKGFKTLRASEDTWSQRKLVKCVESYKDLPPHPNVLKAIGVVSNVASGQDTFFLTSLYFKRGNLEQFSQDPKNKYFNMFTMLAEVAEGLAHMHKYGYAHGGIRAKNVLISDKGHAVIHDFECTKFFVDISDLREVDQDIGDRLLRLGVERGKTNDRWRATELIQPYDFDGVTNEHTYDWPSQTAAGDVWSFGMLLVELYTGLRPYNSYRRHLAFIDQLLRRQLPVLPDEWNTPWMSKEVYDFIPELIKLLPEERPSMEYVVKRMREFEAAYVSPIAHLTQAE